MVGQVPQSAPPAYGKQFAQEQAQARGADQEMVNSDMNRRAASLANIVNNAGNIAAVSGSGAIDQLIDKYPGGETPSFSTPYAGAMDRLRMAGAARKAAGTPAKPKDTSMKAGEMEIEFLDENGQGTGQFKIVTTTGADDAHIMSTATGGRPWRTVDIGRASNRQGNVVSQGNVVPDANTPPPPQETDIGNGIIDHGDGTYTITENGVRKRIHGADSE